MGVAAGLDLRPLTTAEVQSHLTDFGLEPSFASHTKIGGLSGGQKSKLVFAAAMWTRPHVLVRGVLVGEQGRGGAGGRGMRGGE